METKTTAKLKPSSLAFYWRRQPPLGKCAIMLGYVLLICVALSCLLPLLWMAATSLKEYSRVFTYPPEFLPNPITFANFEKLFTTVPFGRYEIGRASCRERV